MFIRLQSSWTYNVISEGIEVISTVKRKRYQLKGDSEKLQVLFEELEIGIDTDKVEQLAKQLCIKQDFIELVIEKLQSENILISRKESLFSEYNCLYDRQIRFFDLFENEEITGEAINNSLQSNKVLIVGLGGYGTWLALMCGRLGIKNITAIDFDIVESTNLNRQILYKQNDVGKYKVEVAKREIESVDPSINFHAINKKITTATNLKPLLENVDFVFNGYGYYPSKTFELLWKECLKNRVPSLIFGGSWVGPLNVPGKTPCLNCITMEDDIKRMVEASQFRYYNPKNTLPVPSLAPRMAFTTSIAVWEAIRFLSDIDRPKTMDGILMFDLFNYHNVPFRHVKIKEDCPSCKFIYQVTT